MSTDSNGKQRILSIDGGGIRGIIPGQFLVEMEKTFNIKIADYFDLIAGTSTGGILTCAYLIPDADLPTQPKYSAEKVVGLYLERGDEIFDVPTWHKIRTLGGILDEKYPEDGIEDAISDYFGNIWLKDLLKPTIITSYDIRRRKGHFFKQQKAKGNPDYNFKVKDVARATSAAPTYFECPKIMNENEDEFPLIDGGVFVNNPALVAYSEGRSIFQNATAEDMKILSLGTGYTRRRYNHSKARNWGLAEWVQPIIDIMMSGGAEVADYQLKTIYDTTSNKDQYLRLNGDLKPTDIDPNMDCATQANMEKLQEFGARLFHDNKATIAKWVAF